MTRPDSSSGEPHHFEWLKGMIAAIFTLNVLDGSLTIYWLWVRGAREANPLMNHLIGLDPVLFMAGKLTLVALGSVLLWRLRHHAATATAIFGLFLVYYVLLLYHLRELDLGLLRRLFA